jgi:hypothetical protein
MIVKVRKGLTHGCLALSQTTSYQFHVVNGPLSPHTLNITVQAPGRDSSR